jgi:hypothetical protein
MPSNLVEIVTIPLKESAACVLIFYHEDGGSMFLQTITRLHSITYHKPHNPHAMADMYSLCGVWV